MILELGSNASLFVHEDADLGMALNVPVPAKIADAGQVCLTPDRFYLHESLHHTSVEGFAARAKAPKVGAGPDPSAQTSPFISRRRIENIGNLIADALGAGATFAPEGH